MKHIKKITIILAIFIFCSCTYDVQHKKEYYSNGILKEEYYKRNGKFEGAYKAFYEDGSIKSIGQFKNEKCIGIWKNYWENGKIQSIQEFKNNRVISFNFWNSDGVQTIKDGTGVGTSYYDDGQISTKLSYKNNVLDGKCETWWENGTKSTEIYYRNGKIVNLKSWDMNGKLIEEKN